MKFGKNFCHAFATVAMVTSMAAAAHADVYTISGGFVGGTAWQFATPAELALIGGAIGGVSPTGTFSATVTVTGSPIGYSSCNPAACGGGSNTTAAYTVSTFLASGDGGAVVTYTNPNNGLPSGTTVANTNLAAGIENCGASSASCFSTIMSLTDTTDHLVNGTTYTFFHDDGIQVYIDGTLVLDASAQTSPENSSFVFGGVTGTHTAEIIYDECCGAPAVLTSNLFVPPTTVPEPASIALFGTVLFGVVAGLRRKVAAK